MQTGWGISWLDDLFAWIQEAIDAVIRMLEAIANIAKMLAKIVWDAIVWAANAVWRAIQAIIKAILDAILAFLKWIWEQLKKVFLAFLDLLPTFHFLEVSDIYIRCLTDPKGCQETAPRRPKLEICWKASSSAMCLGPAIMPTLAEIGQWIVDNLLTPIGNWFASLFGFDKQKTEEPLKVEDTFTSADYSTPGAYQSQVKGGDFKGEDIPYEPGQYAKASNSAGSARLPTKVKTADEDVETPEERHGADIQDDGTVIMKRLAPGDKNLKRQKKIVDKGQELVTKAYDEYVEADGNVNTMDQANTMGGGSPRTSEADKQKARLYHAWQKAAKDLAKAKKTYEMYRTGGTKSYACANCKGNDNPKASAFNTDNNPGVSYTRPQGTGTLLQKRPNGRRNVPHPEERMWEFRKNGWKPRSFYRTKKAPADIEFLESVKTAVHETGEPLLEANERILSSHLHWRHWVSGQEAATGRVLVEDKVAPPPPPAYPVALFKRSLKQKMYNYHPAWDYPHIQERHASLMKRVHPEIKKWDTLFGASVMPTHNEATPAINHFTLHKW